MAEQNLANKKACCGTTLGYESMKVELFFKKWRTSPSVWHVKIVYVWNLEIPQIFSLIYGTVIPIIMRRHLKVNILWVRVSHLNNYPYARLLSEACSIPAILLKQPLLTYLTKDMQPVYTVEKSGFKLLVSKLNPTYHQGSTSLKLKYSSCMLRWETQLWSQSLLK